MNNKVIKKELRNKYLKALKNIDSKQKKEWDESIFQQFINSKYFKNYQVFALYVSFSYEVDTFKIIKYLLEHNKKVALPRMENENLEFYYINSLSDLVIDNQWNIYQPKKNNKVAKIKELELIVVPLIAFNQNYYRLGYGKGYYDRFLSNTNFKALKLVFAYKIQKIPNDIFFIDKWDINFDSIITN